MRRNHTLSEIILSIIAVAFTGVFAVRIYIKAENLQNMAGDLDMASLAAQSALEAFKSKSESLRDDRYTVYFDKDFRAVPEMDENGFLLTMDITDDEMGLFDVKVDVVKNAPYFGETETRVFSLTTSVYKPSRGGNRPMISDQKNLR